MVPNMHAALSVLNTKPKSPNSFITDMLSSYQYIMAMKENAVFIRTNMKFVISLVLSFFIGKRSSIMPNNIGITTGNRMKLFISTVASLETPHQSAFG